jgi:hypothetical protein
LKICNEHQNNKRALAFAFILYDYTSPHVNKILTDKDYWNALNKISGNLLTIFYVDCKTKILNEKVKNVRSGVAYNSVFGIQSKNDDPSIISIKILEKYFGISEQISRPSIMLFQVDNMNVKDSIFVNLKENEVEKTYNEIFDIIKSVTDSLKGISPDCHGNYGCIFREVENSIIHRKHKLIYSKIPKLVNFIDLFSLLFN